MTKRAALILAGGKARRFQGKNGEQWEDKALATLTGRPLLIHAIQNVKSVVDEVAVSVNDEQRGKKYVEILKEHDLGGVHVVVDERTEISGPTVAIMSGLRHVQADYCLTLPCDMPFLDPKVADYLFREAMGFEVTTPMWPNGRLETLLTVLQKHTGLEITETLCELKRPRSDDIQRGATKTLLVSPVKEIKTLDPELKSFININSKEDLKMLQTRRAHGPVKENVELNLGGLSVSDLQLLRKCARMVHEDALSQVPSNFASNARNFEASHSFFWAAASWENQGEALLKLSAKKNDPQEAAEVDFEGKDAFVQAASNYWLEAEMFEENRCMLLAQRALADKAWCESWAMGKHSHTHRYPSKVV
jgi:molybdopterin-guanine dinucleotide biosynthesis protein A